MIDLYYWTTPNGHKITMYLEEYGIPYTIKPINISAGDQFSPDFLKFSPNNRMPAIIDHDPADGGVAQTVFESGAILIYLADKYAKGIPPGPRARIETLEWLMWQMGGLGPMLGQNHHFRAYAPEQIPYAIDRYTNEANRLYTVLNKRLDGRDFIVGDYSIADMAAYPWIVPHERQGQNLDDFPNLKRWFNAIRDRPSTVAAYDKGKAVNTAPSVTEEGKKLLFGQTGNNLGQKA